MTETMTDLEKKFVADKKQFATELSKAILIQIDDPDNTDANTFANECAWRDEFYLQLEHSELGEGWVDTSDIDNVRKIRDQQQSDIHSLCEFDYCPDIAEDISLENIKHGILGLKFTNPSKAFVDWLETNHEGRMDKVNNGKLITNMGDD